MGAHAAGIWQSDIPLKLITWNLQWGRGIDGRVDLARIVKTARAIADFDVFCVQEVADNFPGLEGNDDRDQFAEYARLLPGFQLVAAARASTWRAIGRAPPALRRTRSTRATR